MSVKIFISTVSDEFRGYRDQLRTDLTRHNVEVKVQEDFKDFGGDTLDKLDVYIAHCDAVAMDVGSMALQIVKNHEGVQMKTSGSSRSEAGIGNTVGECIGAALAVVMSLILL